MRRLRKLLLPFFVVSHLLLTTSLPAAAQIRAIPAVSKVLPSVVRITTRAIPRSQVADASAVPKIRESFASGFLVEASGYIVTNGHVVKDAYEILVYLDDGTPHRARIVGQGGEIDLALIKIDTDKHLTPVEFGDSDKIAVGDPVTVIGNPFGLGTTVSAGIVSALNRDLGLSIFDSFIQTDAPINHGNSGGPMFDSEGKVIGVNTAYYTGGNPMGGSIGLGFAIPSNTTREFVRLLKRFGYLRVGWLGVEGATFTPEMADSRGLQATAGAVIADVKRDGPAFGRISRGDVILDADGTVVEDMRMLRRIVATKLGSQITFKILRGRRVTTVSVSPAEWPGSRRDDRAAIRPGASIASMDTGFGAACAPISNETRAQFQLERSQTGVIVTDVEGNSPAFEAGLQSGDVVVMVQFESVQAPEEIATKIKASMADRRNYITLLVRRRDHFMYLTMPARWQLPP